MPKVGKKRFSYTAKGKAAAKRCAKNKGCAKKRGKKVVQKRNTRKSY